MKLALRVRRALSSADETRERTVLTNQLLFAAVAVPSVGLELVIGQEDGAPPAFLLAAVLLFAATGASFLVPWNAIAHGWSALLPFADIVAIGLLRVIAPDAAFNLLWAFPTIWLAASFRAAGMWAAIVGIATIVWIGDAVTPPARVTTATLLVPLAVASLAVIGYLAAQRADTRRLVLERQARFLEVSRARARQQEDTLAQTLDAVDFGVIRIGVGGEIAMTNDAHARLVGGELEGVPVFAADGKTLLDPDDLPLARARRGERFDAALLWYRAPDGALHALAATARPLPDRGGMAQGTVLVTRDVTQEQLALRAREDLVASVSHELRTPLTSILGYVDLALDEDISPAARAHLEVAERNGERLLELVSDILTVIGAGSDRTSDVEIEPRQVDLAPIVMAAVESASAQAVSRGVRLESHPEPASAFVDAHRIRQVVDNLLSNAIKYNDEGGFVRIGITRDELFSWVWVEDDGQGIPADEVPHLFDRFFRSSRVRNTARHGSGLGLAISDGIVRAHRGEITVSTREGEGSTFLVRLPNDAGLVDA